ncbi:arginine/serine-rich coiled-coil protein 2 isoform X2 [Ixodes scapularis]
MSMVGRRASSPQEKPASSCAKVWEKMTFAQDEGGKVTAKFRKLMGIRSEPPPDADPSSDPLLSKQEKLFHDLDQQYEAARLSTHTHRGVGLGYSSQMAAFFQQTNLTK